MIEKLNEPNDCLVVNIGPSPFSEGQADLEVDAQAEASEVITEIKSLLGRKNYLLEYYL